METAAKGKVDVCKGIVQCT